MLRVITKAAWWGWEEAGAAGPSRVSATPRCDVITVRREEEAAMRKAGCNSQCSHAAEQPCGSERRLSFYKWVFAL